jgi:hypothetical protein
MVSGYINGRTAIAAADMGGLRQCPRNGGMRGFPYPSAFEARQDRERTFSTPAGRLK